jgi:hypothetical protein
MSEDERIRRVQGQINLLLEEYRALRAEVTARIGARMTLIGFLAASAALLVGKDSGSTWVYIVVVALMATGLTVWSWSWRLLDKLSRHLAVVETRLNELAAQAYGAGMESGPFTWENQLRAGRAREREKPR